MPRRMITSDIFFNDKFTSVPYGARLLFIGMFTYADDDGRLKALPKYLKGIIFPYEEDMTKEDIKLWRDMLDEIGLINVYSVDGKEYLSLPGWQEHQHIRKDTYRPSILPEPGNNGKIPSRNESVTEALQTRDEPVTQSSIINIVEDSIVKDNTIEYSQVKSSIINIVKGVDLKNKNDLTSLTDGLTDFLTFNLSAPGGPVRTMNFLKDTLWPQLGQSMGQGVFDAIYESLKRYSPPVLSAAIIKAVQYADGKKRPGSYIQKILDEQNEKLAVPAAEQTD